MSNLSIANSSASGTTATVSAWIKKIDAGTVAEGTFQFKTGSDVISFYINPVIKFRSSISGSTSNGYLEANRVIRDNAAWLHITAVIDTTNSTAGDRLRIYINGERLTSFATATYPSQNYVFTPVSGGEFQMGKYSTTDSPVYLSHVHYCDGYAYNADTFGSTDSTTGEWKINTSPTVNYGSNGIFLKFANSASMGTDSSGNNRTMSISGSCLQTKDCPSNNFATMNPLDNYYPNYTFANGNTTVTTGGNYSYPQATMYVNTGKWYWECKAVSKTGGADEYMIGIQGKSVTGTNSPAQLNNGYTILATTGQVYGWGATANYASAYTAGDIIGVALDCTNNKIYWSKNGSWMGSGNPSTGSNGYSINAANTTAQGGYSPVAGFYDSPNAVFSFNFGGGYFGTTAVSSAGTNASGIGIFEYDVPTGYTALSTKGLNE